MKEHKLTIKFYIVFFLIFITPAIYLNKFFVYLINFLPSNNFFNYLSDVGFFSFLSVSLFLFTFFYIFDKWLYWIIDKMFKKPNISGRYEGELISSYKENSRHNVVIEIKQSLTSVLINLYTKNSSSFSVVSAIGKNNFGNWSLYYIYENNTATVGHDEDMKNHCGVAILNILENSLQGCYFNNPRDRGRHGNIDVKFISKKLEYSYGK